MNPAKLAGFVYPTRPGRSGWADAWVHKEAVRLQDEERERAIARWQKEEDERNEREEAEKLLPKWEVYEDLGEYSFSGLLFGAKVRRGGRLTFAAAQAAAKEFNEEHKERISHAKACWHHFLNG